MAGQPNLVDWGPRKDRSCRDECLVENGVMGVGGCTQYQKETDCCKKWLKNHLLWHSCRKGLDTYLRRFQRL